MLLRHQYVRAGVVDESPCPFCGSANTSWRGGGTYSYDTIYCDNCYTEFTFYPPAGEYRMGGPKCSETMERWNNRPETDNEHCPLCGGTPEFEGIMNHHYLFVDAYCPECRVKYQFQKYPTVKTRAGNLKKAKRAFARRAK